MKKLLNQSLMVAILLCLYLLASPLFAKTAFVLVVFFYYRKTKDLSFLGVIGILCIASFMQKPISQKTFQEGKVTRLYANSMLVTNKNRSVLLMSDEPLILDSKIKFEGKIQPFQKRLGFFQNDFESYQKQMGLIGYVYNPKIVVVEQGHSIRSKFQKRIQSIQDSEEQKIYRYLYLQNKRMGEDIQSEILSSSISKVAILYCLSFLLDYFVMEKWKKRILFIITVFIALFYRFPFLFVQRIIYQLIHHYSKRSYAQRVGIGIIILLSIFPYQIKSAAFLFPTSFRINTIFHQGKKSYFLFYSLLLQSLLFHKINIVFSLFYQYILVALGFLKLIGLFCLYVAGSITKVFCLFDHMFQIFNPFYIYGSCFSISLIFFLWFSYRYQKRKESILLPTVCFFVLSYFGLFHPFPSITFINVGQGDSILIRGPCNLENHLIDTGKPSAYMSLSTYLDALNIKKLDTLYITHQDLDHCGNKEQLVIDYEVKHCVEDHFEKHENRFYTFYDLNTIKDEDDENRSSLAHYFNFNKAKILCTGDLDTFAETQIIKEYGNLKADVLKLSHHGSNTGSCAYFLNTLQPKVGIVSCGHYNLYHHPHKDVIQRLNMRRIPFISTYDDGDIMLIGIGPLNLFITSNYSIGILK